MMRTTLSATVLALSALLVLLSPLTAAAQQEPAEPTTPAPAPAPSAPSPSTPAAPSAKLTPKQQIVAFYSAFSQKQVGAALEDLLRANPFVKEGDLAQIRDGFEQLVSPMGEFIDYEVVEEKQHGKRVMGIRCIANFQKQPFVNEFLFYNPGDGDWRLVHLRYDANVATMFIGSDGTN